MSNTFHDEDDNKQYEEFDTFKLNEIMNDDQFHMDDDFQHNFNVLKVLGTGGFGKVFLVEKNSGIDKNTLYAMKIMKKAKILVKTVDIQNAKSEKTILQLLAHPFLVRLFYAFQCQKRLYLILEYAAGGDLDFLLAKHPHQPEENIKFYAAEIALALGHLHQFGIIYRDLKPENIMLDRRGHIKLTDFGLCKKCIDMNGTAKSYVGTKYYMPPEMINRIPYNRTIDWWQLGVVIYELYHARFPFKGKNDDILKTKICRDKLYFPPKTHASSSARNLLNKLLQKDQSKRLGSGESDVEEIKGHYYFKNIDWCKLINLEVQPPYVPVILDHYDTKNFHDYFTSRNTNLTTDEEAANDSKVPIANTTAKNYRKTKKDDPSKINLVECKDIFEGFSYVNPIVTKEVRCDSWISTPARRRSHASESDDENTPIAINKNKNTNVNASDIRNNIHMDKLCIDESDFVALEF